MSIEKLKSGKYRAVIYDKGKRVYVSRSYAKKGEAKRDEDQKKTELLEGTINDGGDKSILVALREFGERLKARRKGKKHTAEVLQNVADFIDQQGIRITSEVTSRAIEKERIRLSNLTRPYRGQPDKPYSTHYIHRRIQQIKSFAKSLHAWGYIEQDVTTRVENISATNEKPKRVLTPGEIQKMFKCFEESAPDLLPFIKFIRMTGFRKLEGVALEWSDINWDDRTVSIFDKPHLWLEGRPFACKWGSGRTLPMNPSLERLLQGQPQTSNFVFTGPKGGNINCALRKVREVINNSGIDRPDEVDLHSLRHTFITELSKTPMSNTLRMYYAGHRSLAAHQRYIHNGENLVQMHSDMKYFPKLHTHFTHTQAENEAMES